MYRVGSDEAVSLSIHMQCSNNTALIPCWFRSNPNILTVTPCSMNFLSLAILVTEGRGNPVKYIRILNSKRT